MRAVPSWNPPWCLRVQRARRGTHPRRLTVDVNHHLVILDNRDKLAPSTQRRLGIHRRELPIMQDDGRSCATDQERQTTLAEVIAQQRGATRRDPLPDIVHAGPDFERQCRTFQAGGTRDIPFLTVKREGIGVEGRAVTSP